MIKQHLKTPIEYLKGVGPQRAEVLKKELHIFTYQDLLFHYPFRYIDRTRFYKIKELNAELTSIQIIGRIVSKEIAGDKHKKRLIVQLKDETGTIDLVWFSNVLWTNRVLIYGSVYIIFGKPATFNGRLTMSHPEFELYNPNTQKKGNLSLQPVYSSTEKLKKLSLDTKGIQHLQATLLDFIIKNIEETLPEYLLLKHRFISRQNALLNIHFPENDLLLKSAQQRVKFDEFFFIQLKLLKSKLLRQKKFQGVVFSSVGEKFNIFYKEKIPFELTEAQKRVIKEIRANTQNGAQMNRLLQGDVGSGKTIVAIMSMLLAIDNGYQACIMAPTEILAQQHYHSIKQLTADDLVNVELLTGSIKKTKRKTLHQKLENGDVDILIGTHALIEDSVKFQNLGLVIIDEQHRFGVEQRAKLWRKNIIPPHVLVMTATPIPRTLAMTVYGDLDVSIINELPAGRKPIKTLHLYPNQRLRMFGFIRKEIEKGRQVYIVYPLIKESEKLDLLYLEAGIEVLYNEFPLPNYRLSIVHGKLSATDKEYEMQRFVKGETHIMIATTVIEVGVNVPNASVMIIENAERFGLAQLHQLRGRVGRGTEESFCILMSGNKLSAEAKVRLQTMVHTQDGFEIAEIDLKLRGPGNLEGTQQSGVLDLKLADVTRDQYLLQQARQSVIDLFEADPELALPENKILNDYFNQKVQGIHWNKIS